MQHLTYTEVGITFVEIFQETVFSCLTILRPGQKHFSSVRPSEIVPLMMKLSVINM
jgi:hypothetical protein